MIRSLLVVATLAALMIGCAATSPGMRADQLRAQHPEWTDFDCERLANHRIWIGMTYDMLIAQRGKPNVVNPSNYGSGVSYQYCWRNWTPSCFYDNDGDGKIDAYN